MADKNHTLATRFLNYSGFIARSDQTDRFSTSASIGRADIFAARHGSAVNIEVKYGVENFRHYPTWNRKKETWDGGWNWKQRRWALMTVCEPYCIPYWIFLGLGKHPPNYNPEKYNPKRSWLIPLIVFHKAVTEIEDAGMKSFPIIAKKGTRKVFQDNNWDAITMFQGYELNWAKSGELAYPDFYGEKSGNPINQGMWITPPDHPFHQQFISCDQIDMECLDDYASEKRGMYDTIIESIPDLPPKRESKGLRKISKRRSKRSK